MHIPIMEITLSNENAYTNANVHSTVYIHSAAVQQVDRVCMCMQVRHTSSTVMNASLPVLFRIAPYVHFNFRKRESTVNNTTRMYIILDY